MSPITRRSFALRAPIGIVGVAYSAPVLATEPVRQADVVVFCEETLRPAIERAGGRWRAQGGGRLDVFVARSDLLLEQIARGARCDVLVVTGGELADAAVRRDLARAESVKPSWRNRLVVVAPEEGQRADTIASSANVAEIFGANELAIADWTVSSAGVETRTALDRLGVWQFLESSVVGSESTEGVAYLLATGKARRGIVYKTNAVADPRLSIVATIPDDAYPPVVYSTALTYSEASDGAPRFLNFLRSPEARPELSASGLEVL
jgi:molybdate transport system substrate-binding protein